MKNTRLCISIIGIIISIGIIVGCSKTTDNKIQKTITRNKVTASSIMTKVVDKYKSEGLSDVKLTAKSSIGVDKNNKIDIAVIFHNYFVNNDVKKCITNLNMKMVVDKTSNHLNMFMNENGNIAYALNNKTFYSADEMYSMFGIKYVAPKMKDIKAKPTDEVEATEDIYKIDGTLAPTDKADDSEEESNDDTELLDDEDEVDATATPRKIYTLDHLNQLGNKLIIKGNKEIDGKECYILKGQIQSIEIRNVLVTYLETSLYSIPKKFGNLDYEIYVDKESYEIRGLTLNLDDIISTLSNKENVSGNNIEFKVEYNTGTKLVFPTTKEFSVDCYGSVLTAFESISNSFKKFK